ncbi:PREDICTED: natural killer cell receptor 2B4-like [Nipponia nippon]|uniref:natural killer cell receptor 2B4-like n=1 Tax=Nipponia nippon TaxID=128390 RepID=UPI0005119EB6|nr:PREDICTED: natural killer cell receptor 2B4-like [Nipponia nippon]
MEHVVLLLLVSLSFLCRAQGPPVCREQAVSADGTLRLQPEKPPQWWARVEWRVSLDAGSRHRILTAEKNNTDVTLSGSPFHGRVDFQQDTLSLRISPVSTADSGVYRADFEDTSGHVTNLCFRVSVWEPVRQPRLEARVLHWEQSWCNLSLDCTMPSASSISYTWSCPGHPLGALEHQPWLHLRVRGDADPTVCQCNVSNPVSWSTASTNVSAACGPVPQDISWPYCRVKGLLCLLVLGSLVAAMVLMHVLVRRRRSPSRSTPGSSGAG